MLIKYSKTLPNQGRWNSYNLFTCDAMYIKKMCNTECCNCEEKQSKEYDFWIIEEGYSTIGTHKI